MESGEQGTIVGIRLWQFLLFLSIYTAGVALALFGSWQSTWLKPDSAMLVGVLSATYMEAFGLGTVRAGRSYVVHAVVVVLAYLVPFVAIDGYRFLERLPPAVRPVVPESPLRSPYMLALGLVVYATLMARAVWIYTRRRRALGARTDSARAAR